MRATIGAGSPRLSSGPRLGGAMEYEYLRVEQREDGIVTVWIDDPDNNNAVNFVMNRELADEIARIEGDDAARILVLTGSGRIFCSGGNIGQMTAQGRSLEPDEKSLHERLYPARSDIRRVTVALRRLSKPAIAAVNGPAVGSGVGLAAGCDVRLASREARFGWVFTRRGILPDDGSLKLVLDILGYARTFEWGVRGGRLGAEEALSWGFVSEVVEPEELLPRAHALAREIIDAVPPLTARLFKLALVDALDRPLEEAIRFTERAQQLARESEDHTEALRAYAERRPPSWSGR